MASGINRFIGIGHLGRDPEVKHTQNGSAVCNLSLAIGERRKKGDGWEDHTEWVRVVCFGKTAEHAGQYLQKGRQVYVEGKLRTTKYQDKKTGEDRHSTEVVADNVTFLGGAPGKGEGGEQRRAPQAASKSAPASDFVDGDDLPF
jgi:single-strand DNA-binding protein